MSNDLREQIYANLNQQDTETLVQIWRANDRVEWSDTAFEVIQQILLERLGELPPQAAPREMQEDTLDDEQEDEGDPDAVFYQPRQVVWLEKWLNRVATISLMVIPIVNLPSLLLFKDMVGVGFQRSQDRVFIFWFLALVVWALFASLSVAIFYFSLKALASILNILMEMEFTSRQKRAKV